MLYEDRMHGSHTYGFAARDKVDRGGGVGGGVGSMSFVPPSSPAPHHGFRRSGAGLYGYRPGDDDGEDEVYSGGSNNNASTVATTATTTIDNAYVKDMVRAATGGDFPSARGGGDNNYNAGRSRSPHAMRNKAGYIGSGELPVSGKRPGDDYEDDMEDELYSFSSNHDSSYRNGRQHRVGGGAARSPKASSRTASRNNGLMDLVTPSSSSLDLDIAARHDGIHSNKMMMMASSSSSALEVGAGLSSAQATRFNEFVRAKPISHRQAQVKVLELLQYWMTSPGVRSRIDDAIQETCSLAEREVGVVKEAWGEAAKPRSPRRKTLPAQDDGTTASSDVSNHKNDINNKGAASPAGPATVATPPSPSSRSASASAGVLPALQSPEKTQQSTTQKSDTTSTPTTPAEGTATPTATPAKSREKLAALPADPVGAHHVGSNLQSTPPPQQSQPTAPSPRLVNQQMMATSTSPRSGDNNNNNNNTAAVEAVAAAAAAGLSATVTVPPVAAGKSDSHASSEPNKKGIAPLASLSVNAKPSSSSTPLEALAVNSSSGGASYDEIPRFYYPLGKPTTRERVMSGPLSKHIENPHLKITEGMTLLGAMLDGRESGNASSSSLSSGDLGQIMAQQQQGDRAPSKTANMSTLRSLDEKHALQYIQKEFARMPPPPPKNNQKVRLLSGNVSGGGNSATSRHHRGSQVLGSTSKQEASYRNHLTQSMQRICMQCFGVPRYFAFTILNFIQFTVASVDVLGAASGTVSAERARPSPAQVSAVVVTAQHVKEFYEAHLKNKSSLRRTFDLLILSSRLSGEGWPVMPAAVAAASQSSKGGTAAAVAAAADPLSLRPYLLAEDFVAYINTILVHHPGLSFLKETPDFQAKYLDTVIYRIFYEIDRFDLGRISFAEFSNSRLMDAFRQVDACDDINAVLLFFSYEHFYVLYCRFWELDENRDMMLSPADFSKYAPEDVMNPLLVQRVFAGAGRRVRCPVKGFIGYEDFVWFCLSEEDKTTATAIRYWFRVLDTDGDGLLSVYELRAFYDQTREKISEFVQDGAASFDDVICQIFDMTRCQVKCGITLSSLLREPMAAHVALNMLTNVVRFLQFEQRDPFVAHHERLLGGVEQCPWDRFARAEYDRMAQEADE